jgi:hypothetical protein
MILSEKQGGICSSWASLDNCEAALMQLHFRVHAPVYVQSSAATCSAFLASGAQWRSPAAMMLCVGIICGSTNAASALSADSPASFNTWHALQPSVSSRPCWRQQFGVMLREQGGR